jgi:hypothetical protein
MFSPSSRSLQDVEKYLTAGGVSVTRTILQVGGAILMIFIFHGYVKDLKGGEKALGYIALALIGDLLGSWLWQMCGTDVEAFLDDLFPWFSFFDPTTEPIDIFPGSEIIP